jgi:hypothetical protein
LGPLQSLAHWPAVVDGETLPYLRTSYEQCLMNYGYTGTARSVWSAGVCSRFRIDKVDSKAAASRTHSKRFAQSAEKGSYNCDVSSCGHLLFCLQSEQSLLHERQPATGLPVHPADGLSRARILSHLQSLAYAPQVKGSMQFQPVKARQTGWIEVNVIDLPVGWRCKGAQRRPGRKVCGTLHIVLN